MKQKNRKVIKDICYVSGDKYSKPYSSADSIMRMKINANNYLPNAENSISYAVYQTPTAAYETFRYNLES
jgi:hypothetical protein